MILKHAQIAKLLLMNKQARKEEVSQEKAEPVSNVHVPAGQQFNYAAGDRLITNSSCRCMTAAHAIMLKASLCSCRECKCL